MTIETQFESCVDQLYASLSDPSRLQGAIRSLRLMFDATGATHLFHTPQGQIVSMVDDGHAPEDQRLFMEYYGALDPTRVLLNLRPGEWLRDDRLLDPAHTPQPEYVNDFAPRIGMRWFRGCKVYEGAAGIAHFSIQRGADAAPFDDSTLVLLERVKPHLSRVFRISVEMRSAVPALASATAAMDALRMAVCVVDDGCKLIYANPSAEEFLSGGAHLRLKAGHLVSPNPHVQATLRHAVALACRPPRQASLFSPEPMGTAVNRLQLRVLPLAPHLPLAHYGHGNLALVFVAAGAPAPSLLELQQLFGLTRAESELVRMIVQGSPPEVCAQLRQVSLETIRTQLKSIYAKTGAGTQAQLVSLALALPALK